MTLTRRPPMETSRRVWPKALPPVASIAADAPARVLTKCLRFGMVFTRRVDNTGDRAVSIDGVGSRQSGARDLVDPDLVDCGLATCGLATPTAD